MSRARARHVRDAFELDADMCPRSRHIRVPLELDADMCPGSRHNSIRGGGSVVHCVVPGSGILAQNGGQLPFNLVVVDNQPNNEPLMYSAHAPPGGALIGAMTKLRATNSHFTFTSDKNVDYGEFLVSVNGLSGNDQDRTYWELLVKGANKVLITADVGISCYIPQANETVILNYTKW
ncbi:unnamed protein product [Arctogadus glacialis]